MDKIESLIKTLTDLKEELNKNTPVSAVEDQKVNLNNPYNEQDEEKKKLKKASADKMLKEEDVEKAEAKPKLPEPVPREKLKPGQVREGDISSDYTDRSLNPETGGKYGKIHGGNPKKPAGQLKEAAIEHEDGKYKQRVSGASELRNEPKYRLPLNSLKKEELTCSANGQWSLDKTFTPEQSEKLYNHQMEQAKLKMQHGSTGQHAVKEYTSAIQGTAEEQAGRQHEAQHGKAGVPKVLSGDAKVKAVAAFKPRAQAKGMKLK